MALSIKVPPPELVGGGDALIVVPPFAVQNWPALGVHLLQAAAAREGLRVRVLYANLLLASAIGERNYHNLSQCPTSWLLGERLFARAAYGTPPLGKDGGAGLRAELEQKDGPRLSFDALLALESQLPEWLDAWVPAIAGAGFPIIGCTSSFEQTSSSLAILRRVRQSHPGVVTIIGGANCEGEMARGIAALCGEIDHVFAGECEEVFPRFLLAARKGARPTERILEGEPCRELDALAEPQFDEYFEQLDVLLPGGQLRKSNAVWLPYESSRGCWWGQKHHCTFCGLNGQGMSFRQKQPERVRTALRDLTDRYGVRKVCMVDNIMPHGFFRTLLPQLAADGGTIEICYEEKANLSFEKVRLLHTAGVKTIQPGIEALASELLSLMDKGVLASQNIALLRYARAFDMQLQWNLLCCFPGDLLAWYTQTLELVPMLRHLCPPTGIAPLSIDRFSPYFVRPAEYGIQNVRPRPEYAATLPEGAPLDRIAYHFTGDYRSASREAPELIGAIRREVGVWRRAWEVEPGRRPRLEIVRRAPGRFEVIDTRGVRSAPASMWLDAEQARCALVPAARAGLENGSDAAYRELLAARMVVELDGRFIPLATASSELLAEFEGKPGP